MEAPSTPSGRRTLTPAVLLAVIFTTACALATVAFVAARGGLDLPLAMPAASDFARASIAPSQAPSPAETSPSAPSATPPAPSGAPTPTPTPTPTIMPAPTPGPSPDPLTALPACPDHPGCYEYAVRRGDTLSTISDRWGISLRILEALNPRLTSPGTIVVGQILFLGRDPHLGLAFCPDGTCYLYVVRPGDRLSTIASIYGDPIKDILLLNAEITDPNAIYSGQVIRLPGTGSCCG
ncbi:MAG TPA: LysM peptidoglycan-binding domain-containing protein [Candidatus Limnocylindrales bacterium]|nr:LysM peptidoglycan-binding domain-containing protein [Candidatus Limnocylindrales bacterium]